MAATVAGRVALGLGVKVTMMELGDTSETDGAAGVAKVFTPKDFERELGAWQGSAFSLEPILTQSAWFRTHNRDDVIPNLYFVGAGTHPGAGVPGVIGSAKATAGLMLSDLGASA